MGVRGLETYLEKYCPDACYSVNITHIIREYTLKHGEKPEIVVDAQSCYKLWTQGMDWLTGFEIKYFINRLRSFVNAFDEAGAKLVFFFGGLTAEKKRTAWIERRKTNLEQTLEVFDIIESSSETLPKYFRTLPPNTGITTSCILKYVLNCTVYMSIDECDEEIFEYVKRNNSFAIFGQDTDFIINDLEAIVLSSKNLELSSMTTLLYDRRKLAENLSISVSQLPYLSILAGNDLIPYPSLVEFHRRLCDITQRHKNIPFQILIPKLGYFIEEKLPLRASADVIFKIISNEVYGQLDIQKVKLMKMSYDSYIIKPVSCSPSEDEWSRILHIARHRHKNTIAPTNVYSVLSEQTFETSLTFEDLRKIHDGNKNPVNLPSATITRPLRQRFYGVLLHEKKQETPILVKEWCNENTNSYVKPVCVKPIKVTAHHPGLIALWSDSNSNRMNDIRWDLFLTSVHPTIKVYDWKAFGEDLLLPTLVLYYLYEEKYLSKHEVHAVAATLATNTLYKDSDLRNLKYGKLDLRAACISVTIIRTYGILLTLLASCGFPIPMTNEIAYLPFEGKLFQIKYNDAVMKRARYKELCGNNDRCLKTFYKIKDMICKDPRRDRDRRVGTSGNEKRQPTKINLRDTS